MPLEYTYYINIVSLDLIIKYSNNTKINKHTIKLIDNKLD